MQTLVDPPAPMTPEFVAIRSVRDELPDTFTLEIEPPEGFSFEPGQFTMLYAYGVGEVPISGRLQGTTLTLTIEAPTPFGPPKIKGEIVEVLQALLVDLGYDLDVDGFFGEATEAALAEEFDDVGEITVPADMEALRTCDDDC